MSPEAKRIKRFCKMYQMQINKTEMRGKQLYIEIVGKWGEIRGLFNSPRELSEFLYKASKERWRSRYYEKEHN